MKSKVVIINKMREVNTHHCHHYPLHNKVNVISCEKYFDRCQNRGVEIRILTQERHFSNNTRINTYILYTSHGRYASTHLPLV